MNTKRHSVQNSKNGIVQLIVLVVLGVLIIVALIATLKIRQDLKQANEKPVTTIQKVIKVPAEIKQALENLEKNIGTIDEQRQDIDKISKALKDGTATTGSLGKKGNTWLHDFRRKVEVREAVLAWQEIQKMSAEFAKSPKWVTTNAEKKKNRPLETAEKLAKIVSSQIESSYARGEGFQISHGELYDIMYPLRNGGKKRE